VNLQRLLWILFLMSCLVACRDQRDASALKIIHLKQGCSFLCPDGFQIQSGAIVEKVNKNTAETLNQVRSELLVAPQSGGAIFIAERKDLSPAPHLEIAFGPPELSQAELKAFTPAQTKKLAEVMFKQAAPVLKRTDVMITKRIESKIVSGPHLSSFVWAYEFTDTTKIPQIDLRHYYYTKSATFVVVFTSSRDYFDKNEKNILGALQSLNVPGHQD
jgi:hypothetical protein